MPLDVNEDEKEESDEDMEQPVFNFEVFPFRLGIMSTI